MPPSENTDLVLTNGTFVLLRDNTKGVVSTIVGPLVHSRSGSETPVTWDAEGRVFVETDFRSVVQRFVTADRNQYVVLRNPAKNAQSAHPATASKQMATDLRVGETEIIAGPCTFALWPGQSAEVIDGHKLRYNEFLLIEVVDEDAAAKNWKSAVMKVAEPSKTAPQPSMQLQTTDGTPGLNAESVELQQPASVSKDVPKDLAVGQQYLVKGTDVRFYIPPTGVRVVPDERESYVRQALTLEIMEYAILVDENGIKSFPRGPVVVFPNPTQRFITAEDGTRSFRPIELNPIQGLHLKALADHEFMGKQIKEGTEFFLTGEDVQIYYPNPNHAQVKYDGQAKSFATSVPKGESRYVLDRNSGEVELVLGPTMLLPNPVTHVLVRRVLTANECALWYPGNQEALDYNTALRAASASTPTTRSGTVSEGQVSRNSGRLPVGTRGATAMESSHLSYAAEAKGEEIDRKSTYNAPRTITLDTKYAGAPVILPSPGYSVLVVGKNGNRKVIVNGERHHLEYDETLQPFVFSTGRPKSGKQLRKDVYLRSANNAVRDEIEVLTSDHVQLKVYVSLRVGFTGETQEEMVKWWAVENYVKFLTDHVRSKVKASIRQVRFADFYTKSAEYIRNIILGAVEGEGPEAKRKGLFFSENNLNVFDVEVLEVNIADVAIKTQLDEAMRKTVVAELTLSQDRIRVQNLGEQAELQEKEIDLQDAMADRSIKLQLHNLERLGKKSELERELKAEAQEDDLELRKQADTFESDIAASRLARDKAREEQEVAFEAERQKLAIELVAANTTSTVDRYKAVEGQLTQALVALGDRRTLVDLADATSLQRFVGGKNVAEAFKGMFGDGVNALLGGIAHRAFDGMPKIDRGSSQSNGHA